MRDNLLEASIPDDHDNSLIEGVSLTSELQIALKFANEAKERDYENYWQSPVNDGCIIAFDGHKLKSAYQLKKIVWDGSRSEREYRTIGPIYDPGRLMTSIFIDNDALNWWINTLDKEGETTLSNILQSLPAILLPHPRQETILNTLGLKI